MCRTTYSSSQSSNTLNYWHTWPVWSLTELASLYTVPLNVVNGLSRLTKLAIDEQREGTADSIRKFSNRPIPFESNGIESEGRFEFESNLEASQVPMSESNKSAFKLQLRWDSYFSRSALCSAGENYVFKCDFPSHRLEISFIFLTSTKQ